MDEEKVWAVVWAVARAEVPGEEEEEEQGQAPRGGEPVREEGLGRNSRPPANGRPMPRREPAFARTAAPRPLTG